MITYQNTQRRPAAFNSMFGFSVVAFDALFLEFAQAHHDRLTQSELTRKNPTLRQRRPGAGRKFRHELRDRLLLTLFWLRVYPTLELLGFFFSLDKTSAEDNLKDILATLQAMTTFALEHPDKTQRKRRTLEQIMDAFPEVAVIIDAKEQRLQRPKTKPLPAGTAVPDTAVPDTAVPCSSLQREGEDRHTPSFDSEANGQKPYYSGKKKCHTLKTQLGVRPDGTIVAVSASVPGANAAFRPGGANHDLTLLRQTGLLDQLDTDEAAMMDKGYDGITKDYPTTTLYLPFKARRDHPLTDEQKAYNRFLSHYRIVVEHTNAQLNVFQVLVQTYRHCRHHHGQIVRIVAGLVNRRIAQRPLKRYGVA